MNKNKKTVIIAVLAIALLILIIFGVFSLSKHNKKKTKEEIYTIPEEEVIYDDGEMINTFSSSEEVLEKIQNEYGDSHTKVTFKKEENSCWYFEDNKKQEYVYCINDPRIIKIEKDNVKKNK